VNSAMPSASAQTCTGPLNPPIVPLSHSSTHCCKSWLAKRLSCCCGCGCGGRYFAVCVFFDIITLGVVLFNTIKLQTSPQAFYEGVCVGGGGMHREWGRGVGSCEQTTSEHQYTRAAAPSSLLSCFINSPSTLPLPWTPPPSLM
jgi:hypothetical protein